MSAISFTTKRITINGWTILHLPESASKKLPSRGMVMVKGTINLPTGKAGDVPFKALLEPDGQYGHGLKPSHWFKVDETILKNIDKKADPPASAMLKALRAGDTVQVSLEPTKEWIEPEVPTDVKKALSSSAKAKDLWEDITPMARWDWIRWVRAVKTPETRQKHLDVMLDKLNKGMRRPCCFNRNLCSEPHVSKNWVLLAPTTKEK